MKADCIKWIKKSLLRSCNFITSRANTDAVGYINATLVLSKGPVLRYQVGTKKMKTSRYHVSLSPGGTEYPVVPVLAA